MKGNIMKYFSMIVILLSTMGCSTTQYVEYRVKSEPPNCPIELNGVLQGNTPTNIQVRWNRKWVGLANSPDGYSLGGVYEVTCFPPTNSTMNLVSQTKRIMPENNPNGADLFFNLTLSPVAPFQTIDITDRRAGDDSLTENDEKNRSKIMAVERMKQIKQLKDGGFISQDEYEIKRKEILNAL